MLHQFTKDDVAEQATLIGKGDALIGHAEQTGGGEAVDGSPVHIQQVDASGGL